MPRKTLAALAGAALLTLAAGCGSSDTPAADAAAPESSTTSTPEAQQLTFTDPWVKAADSGMTAAFGTLENTGDQDLVVTSATSDATSAMELHETVANDDGTMAMQPKQGGFSVEAGGQHELAPGGDHLMFMDLTRPLQPGEDVTITLTFEDGSTSEVDAVVKNFTGADENYQNHSSDMGGM
jgi:periplasmic copper chaperone A